MAVINVGAATETEMMEKKDRVELCPDVFKFDENEEKANVKLPEGGEEECIEEAISTCPVECIHWEDN